MLPNIWVLRRLLKFHMDWSTVFRTTETKQVYVLKPYLSNSMDELARDLNMALDESSDRGIHEGKARRSKSLKCHSKSKSSVLESSVPQSSTKSEDSESSNDNWIQRQMDSSSMYHQTDSDNILSKYKSHGNLSWRQCALNMGESDSVNENLRPSRVQRRKRKFKRMSIDPPSANDQEFSALPNVALFSQNNNRSRSLKDHKLSKLLLRSPRLSKKGISSHVSPGMENFCKGSKSVAISNGKRKRCAQEKSIECSGYDCKDSITNRSTFDAYMLSSTCRHMKYIDLKSQEISSSDLSSSDSDDGLFNPESREADDEQSDTFQESDSISNIHNISPWCEENKLQNKTTLSDPNFQDIFQSAESARKTHTAQIDKNDRQIRSARRRLGYDLNSMISSPDKLSPQSISRNNKTCLSLVMDSILSKTSPNEKKRKGMSFSSESVCVYGESTCCVQEASLEFQVLKKNYPKPDTELQSFDLSIDHEKQKSSLSNASSENSTLSSQLQCRKLLTSPPPSPLYFLQKNDSLL